MTKTHTPMRKAYVAFATLGATTIVVATALGALGLAIGL